MEQDHLDGKGKMSGYVQASSKGNQSDLIIIDDDGDVEIMDVIIDDESADLSDEKGKRLQPVSTRALTGVPAITQETD